MIAPGDIKDKWRRHLARLDYALQPIVRCDSGGVVGFEARLQHHGQLGFATPARLFDGADQDGLCHQVDLVLRKKAIEKFYAVPFRSRAKLLFRLDARILESGHYQSGRTARLLRRSHVPQEAFLFVVEEGGGLQERRLARMTAVAMAYRRQGFSVADIHQSMEEILACYTADECQEGVFIADQGRYVGYLSAAALLKIVNQKNLSRPRLAAGARPTLDAAIQ